MSRYAALSMLLLASPLLAQPLSPADAVAKMKLPDGFTARCVASEPMIRQPLSISFDHTGRLWVLQYLQYPNPAGLKPVKQDQYLRTQWDKVLDPPPKGPKGLDKVTICYDPDANGVFQKSKDFVTGLNVASGFCLANDGVYVVQPPYLLFYADKNHDDVPDGDPEVLLKGFGLDDTHSLANSLQFGPDGWLYGAAGSTSTSKIEDPSGTTKTPIEFQQGIWRYHPQSKRFELFSEGGGNTYGLDFDANGQCIAGTNWGGFACLHHLPGAYYVKGFSKHGPLHNPHAYGYFDHVPYKGFKGGHVTCGGVIYDADAYPKEFRGQYIAGNLLSNAVYTHKLTPKGASFTAEHGTDLLVANDDQFRPVDLQLGPDGCVYVADWYDKRAAHLDPIDNWDKTNGRVYKIEYTGAKPQKPFDLRKMKSAELVELLKHPNIWWRRMARQELIGREDVGETFTALRELVGGKGSAALEALWVLHECAPSIEWPTADTLFDHPNPHVRAWAVRLLAQEPNAFTTDSLERFLGNTATDESPTVLAAYLCAVRQLPPVDAGKLFEALLERKGIDTDPSARLLLWWAYLHITETVDDGQIGTTLRTSQLTADTQAFLIERAVRRGLSSDHDGDRFNEKLSPVRVLRDVDEPLREAVLRGIEAAVPTLPERHLATVAETLAKELNETYIENRELTFRILISLGHPDSIAEARRYVADDKHATAERVKWVAALGRVRKEKEKAAVGGWLLSRLKEATSDDLRLAFVGSVESTTPKGTADGFLELYPKWSAAVKKRAVQALLSKPEWAVALFKQLDAGAFPKADVSVEQAKAAVAFDHKELTPLVEKHFGKLSATAGEKQARIASLNTMLGREKPGDPAKGKAIFTKACGACHQLFGEGGKVGPDLTTADRKNRGSLLASIVDPSGYIRPEYVTQVVNTLDGRTLTGVMSAQTPQGFTLSTYANDKVETLTLAHKDVDKVTDSGVSLMPEKLLDTMSEPEIRDLFAYLGRDEPRPPGSGDKEPLHGGRGSSEKKDEKKKLKLALVSGADEYKSNEVMPVLQKRLEENYPVECVRIFFTEKDTDFSKLEKLTECDAAVFFTRRLKIGDDQVKAVKAYCDSGKPVIGIRTASHGFQTWLEMDTLVYGGNYKNHYKAGDKWELKLTPDGEKHPILKGVKPWASEASLYRNTGAAKDITVLMTGGGKDGTEPVTWVRAREVGEKKVKQRIFYTSLGHQQDFEEENFLKLLVNGISWATQDARIGK